MVQQDDWFRRYKFCQPIGRGGMGVVYLAQDTQRNMAECVIKQLSSKSLTAEEAAEAIRLFSREAEILRTLDHPGIVRVFDDHATEDGNYFLVMDFVPGKNLDMLIATYGSFNSEATIEIAIQCCEVLEYLHELHPPVLYRDLKPSNLMLTPDGRIVFIDFGIARTSLPQDAATRVITAGYSPPEQYFGRPESRSDLYALGATLFHLLTGQRPKPISVSAPRSFEPKVMVSLDALVQRLTSHNVEERPDSARHVRYELYHLYKEIHPEFEIPDEALVSLTMSKRSARDSKILPRRGVTSENAVWHQGLVEESAAGVASPDELRNISSSRFEKLTKRQEPEPEPVIRRRSEQPSTIWQRVKEWWTINFQ
ncbi:MAG TPA: serine/threonine-protein kinase [Oculatellaceae cyanobacterium]